MDLLSRRYASPLFILEQMISCEKFSEFISSLYDFDNDTKLWEIYLHKVYGKSFDEWKSSLHIQQNEIYSKQAIETTIINSFNLLQEFKPESGVS